MNIKDVKLRKGMVKDEVNELIGEWLILEDDVYLGNSYKHSWTCKCGNVFKRQWGNVTNKVTTQRCNLCSRSIKINNIVKINVNINNLKDAQLHKGMSKDKVNKIIGKWINLDDDIYLGTDYKHNWRCKCGNVFERRWHDIRANNNSDCGCIEYNKTEQRYKYEVEETGEYKYIRSFRRGEILPNGDVVKVSPYIQVKHKYCGNVYEVTAHNFLYIGNKCGKCCGSYENSFAYYIERILGEPLEKYWDFKKNTVNPYCISKGMHSKNSKGENAKVWIKCTEKDYHGSYEISCNEFTNGVRCGYCNPSGTNPKVHPLDSFGYKHFDKAQSWHPNNNISPFRVAPASKKKIKFICGECGNVWGAVLSDVSRGSWCPQCSASKGEKKIIDWLRLNDIEFISQKTFYGLIGLGGKNLSYDFYLPNYNLLIEYQGEFHDGNVPNQTKAELIYQQEHDRRKREYAKVNNINLLEIWYYDFDNIEEILKNELNI